MEEETSSAGEDDWTPNTIHSVKSKDPVNTINKQQWSEILHSHPAGYQPSNQFHK